MSTALICGIGIVANGLGVPDGFGYYMQVKQKCGSEAVHFSPSDEFNVSPPRAESSRDPRLHPGLLPKPADAYNPARTIHWYDVL